MKTPTKETEFEKGIKHGLLLIADAYCKGKLPTEEQLSVVEGKVKEMLLHIQHPRTIALVAILEWEKIRNLDARVEEMCKNNPGTKDWLDFYNAINSTK